MEKIHSTKTAFSSMWNSFKHGFHTAFSTKFNQDSPICLLGQFYHTKMLETVENNPSTSRIKKTIIKKKRRRKRKESSENGNLECNDNKDDEEEEEEDDEEYEDYCQEEQVEEFEDDDTIIVNKVMNDPKNHFIELEEYVYEKFRLDFSSRIWLTYRKDFVTLPKSNLSTDTGWGCMIRSGQMILAQALIQHFLGRDWIWNNHNESTFIHREHEQNPRIDNTILIHRMIVKWFLDDPNSLRCPFSLHELVKIGTKMGKKPGDWFGPSSISFALKAAIERASENIDELSDLCCYIAQDCTIYLQDLQDLCFYSNPMTHENPSSSSSSGEFCSSSETSSTASGFRSVIILIPVRLGTKYLNPIYNTHIKQILSLPQCIGIIGGKPRHSLYFIGFQDDKLIYLDPHYSQKAISINDNNFSLNSFHCNVPRKASFHTIDPSCAFGFYIKTKHEFDDFLDTIHEIIGNTKHANDYPVFIIDEGRATQYEKEYEEQNADEQILRMNYRVVDSHGNVQKISSEEFILL